MKSEELQRLTASEPLTLEEEYNMQKSWREDEDSKYFLYKLLTTKKINSTNTNTVIIVLIIIIMLHV